jgi:hypothetical protein
MQRGAFMLFKNIGIVDENFDYVKSMFVETKDDRIVYVSSVRPENYEAFFAVSDYVTNSVSPLHLIKNMQKAADYMASVGIGMIHSVSGVGFSHDLDVDMERYFPNHGYRKGNQTRSYKNRRML